MTYPTKPADIYDYVAFQEGEPTMPPPAPRMAADYQHLKQAADQIIDFIKKPIDSNGNLKPDAFLDPIATKAFVQAELVRVGKLIGDSPVYDTGFPGATERTLLNRLQDAVSVKDFGATGIGNVDDAAKIQAALNAGFSTVVFPAGTYYVGDAGIKPKSGQTIVLHRATLRKYVSSPTGTPDKTQALFDLQDVSDVTFVGGTIRRGNDKQWGVRLISGCHNIKFIGTLFKDVGAYPVASDNTKLAFLGCVFDCADGTVNTPISIGSPINPTTAETTGAPGFFDGFQLIGCTLIGGGNEALDLNWPVYNAVITNNLFIRNHTAGSDDEVLDVGGSCLLSATVASGGSGYAVGDVVDLDAGSGTVTSSAGIPRRARLRIDAVSGGAATAVSVTMNSYADGSFGAGHYQLFPGYANLPTTAVTGTGTGLTINPKWGHCQNVLIANNVFVMNPDLEGPVIRIKWETRRVNVHDNIAYFPTTPAGNAFAVKVEQSHDVSVTDNIWINSGRGHFVQGPCDNVTIARNTARGLRSAGITTSTTTSNKDITRLTVLDNTFTAQASAPGPMMTISSTLGARISGNSITTDDGNTNCDGISILLRNENLKIIDNSIRGGNRGIIVAAGATPLVIKDNLIEVTVAEGIRLEGQNDYSEVSDNRIRDAGNNGTAYSLVVVDADWTKIADNLIWDGERGLNIGTGGTWDTIRGNTVNVTTTPYMNLDLLGANCTIKDNIPASGAGYQSVILADDTAVAIPLATAARIEFASGSTSAPSLNGGIWARCTGSPDIANNGLLSTTNVTLTTSTILTGTTGTDGNMTVSATNGVLYIENRSGAVRNVALSVLARF